ncbi:DUF2335 domain-containing protein [Pyramidobacter piscolens]|uniref:DUF2335 domain-containing protein n=1 Tax=Pyramidobacter piscolens TaxID=638849 RepID=UPI001FCA905B|nr:DUF2335 domain-containing protein [Pyramidobacter piscolens]BDF77844.1 hypothetical protein CE91St28_06380 [Pyramidobacter piscolens]
MSKKASRPRQETSTKVTRRIQQTRAVQYRVSGPLPSAIEMRGYASISPDLPERIVAMAEQQAEHRQRLENKVVEGQLRNQRLGTLCACALGVCGIVGGTVTSIYGPWYNGLASWILAFGSLLWAFIYGTKSNREERQEKWRQAMPSEVSPAVSKEQKSIG